jgi:SRSO17 transposase
MTPSQLKRLDRELGAYVEYLTSEMGRPERRAAMGDYLRGLLLEGERKSVVPMAARMAEDASDHEGLRQRLQRCVKSSWEDEELYRRVATKLERELPGIEAFVLDDTGFAKKGVYSVGVARQYSGTLGRTDNCQVAVSLHLAGEQGSGCIGLRLYLPESWTEDRQRCRAAGVPDEAGYEPKWKLALGLIDQALGWGVRPPVALADSGYGDTTEFRDGLTERGLIYNVAVKGTTVVWRPGVVPRPPKNRPGQPGRPRTRPEMGSEQPVSIAALAMELGKKAYRKVSWREGSRGKLASTFAAVRIRRAHGHAKGAAPGQEEWMLCEWPENEKAPTKFYLSTQPASCSLKALVRTAHLRWRVERDYQDMKQEVGLDSYEGRTWRGFHHHAALCAAAHAFLALRRALFPPEQGAMDPADGAAASSADSDRQAHRMSAVPPQDDSSSPASWPIAHVTNGQPQNAIR